MQLLKLELASDYGCLALLDTANYLGFVDEDWELEQLKSHIRLENSRGNIVAWGCTSCNWKIEIHLCAPTFNGCRSHKSSLITEGKLLITTYDSITMAAQFSDTALPEKHEEAQVVEIEKGAYEVTVIQNFPTELIDTEELWEQTNTHYFVFLEKVSTKQSVKGSLPWFTV